MWRFKKQPSVPLNALVDASSRILLALSTSSAAIVFLAESTRDTFYIPSVNYVSKVFLLNEEDTDHFPHWTWSASERRFVSTRRELITQTMRDRSRLAVQKTQLIKDIMRGISIARYPVSTGTLFQETLYLMKKMQAETCKEEDYSEERIMQYPLVAQYADFAGLSLREATDDILFKAKLDEELLAKTELLRMKYFKLVKEASLDQLPSTRADFVRESQLNSLL